MECTEAEVNRKNASANEDGVLILDDALARDIDGGLIGFGKAAGWFRRMLGHYG